MSAATYFAKYSKKDIEYGELLGQGSFGVVQKGKINGIAVALKILRMEMTQDAEIELNVMAKFSHRNVLKLLGIIAENFSEKPTLVFEFMENGSLSDFVRKQNLSDITLTSLAYDIACGMDYLHEMQFIHRDLAGRNVLIDSKKKAKVADFGLSRFVDVDESSYYKIGKDKPLPVRWVPKESIPVGHNGSSAKFSFASDVWSFGVTMWEAWMKGAIPYRKFSSNSEVADMIMEGSNPNTFEKPCCSPLIMEIMDSIFKLNPKERPTFAALKVKLATVHGILTNGAAATNKTTVKQASANADVTQLAKQMLKLNLKSGSTGHQKLVDLLKEKGLITTAAVERVMRAVDRGDYASKNPYINSPQSIGCNVNTSAPHMHAIMLELVAEKLKSGGKGLDVGSGSGYITTCMALLVGPSGKVIGIDHMTDLVFQSADNVTKTYPELINHGIIKFVVGDGRRGYAKEGPYDVIHIGAATPVLHQSLIDQVNEGGRIVTAFGPPGGPQQLVVADKIGGKIKITDKMGVIFAPLTSQTEQLQK